MERQCQRRIHGVLETLVTGEPQLLESEPGRTAEAALQPLHRVQAVGQAPKDPDNSARFVQRQGVVRMGVRVHQVGDAGCTLHDIREALLLFQISFYSSRRRFK